MTAEACGGHVAGVDEAGRGPLAGPVVAGAVILDSSRPIDGIDDSKKLSHTRRETLYDKIVSEAVAWAVAEASPADIDRLNVLGATHLAMHKALESLKTPWVTALVDGNRPIGAIASARQKTVVGGDGISASIGAASIVAKVTRDRIMMLYDREYPQYLFKKNKGYPTREHREAIVHHGLCPIHRRSFCLHLTSRVRLPL
ncbi:MAG: ribonuclease HII [Chitinivibrionales bacterium]|nr:ribonuclease HII [Chitinivibrionales bacterium]MBD3356918.1 ribonuclease HII [Chitinivibrionales bacterium]